MNSSIATRCLHAMTRSAIALSAIVFLLLAAAAGQHAQASPCGLTSMTEQSQLVYPPIARAAHVSGTVVLLARFDTHGVPMHIKVLSGAPMLQAAALDFVKGWRANDYTGPRECPIVVNFNIESDVNDRPVSSDQRTYIVRITHADLQHVTITTHSVVLYSEERTTNTDKRQF